MLTSATLRVGNSFEFVKHRLGLGGSTQELTLVSPFDYLSQALCVATSDMPAYDDPRYDAVLAGLIADIAIRLGGRTLALFTGYGPLRRACELLGDRLAEHSIAVLGQGIDGTRRQILNSFIENPRSILCGTASFWEGIDIPGDALRCVVIAKLPFSVPTDPLVGARTAQLNDSFRTYLLPQAVIRLRQGFGRLIRHRDDRGAVVLCDQRLVERRYAATFLEALPPAAQATLTVAETGSIIGAFIADGVIPEMARTAALAPQSDGWELPIDHEDPA